MKISEKEFFTFSAQSKLNLLNYAVKGGELVIEITCLAFLVLIITLCHFK